MANKANYIGKPLSILEQDLKLKIKKFSPFGVANRYEETTTTFYFRPVKKQGDLFYPRLEIFWSSPLDMRKSDSLSVRDRKNLGIWDKEAKSFYAPAIIADIRIR